MDDELRHHRILRMLKNQAIEKLSSTSNSPLSVPALEELMHNVFPQSFHTPSHPTYASMIMRAIEELKEEKGSREEEISAFIQRKYNDLPWGHHTFLSHHLRKLCKSGEIKCSNDGRFMLSETDGVRGRSTPLAL